MTSLMMFVHHRFSRSLTRSRPHALTHDAGLPFRAIVDYHDVAKDAACDANATRILKGLRIMVVMQAQRDLWAAYPASTTHPSPAKRGPAALHHCGVTSSLVRLLNGNRCVLRIISIIIIAGLDDYGGLPGGSSPPPPSHSPHSPRSTHPTHARSSLLLSRMPSLRDRAARVSQIEKCLRVLAQLTSSPCDFAAIEWRACLAATLDVVACIGGGGQGSIIDNNTIAPHDDHRRAQVHRAAVAVLDSLSASRQNVKIDSKSIELLRKSLDLLLVEPSGSSETEGKLMRGKAFALTSLVQLSLSRPYEAFDPSLAGEMERDALIYSIEHFYTPELRIRDSYSHLPLADRQLDACRELDRRVATLEDRRGAISRLTCARPEASQYLDLREDISTFVTSLVEVSRVEELLLW